MAFQYGVPIGPKRLGVDLDAVHTTQKHEIGLRVWDSMGKKYVYIKAAGSIAIGNFIKGANADDPYSAAVIGTASAAATYVIGMAPQTLASGDYGFVLESGVFEDDAQLVSANLVAGQPVVCDANGDADIAAATDINNARGICLVDDTDNTGTLLLF